MEQLISPYSGCSDCTGLHFYFQYDISRDILHGRNEEIENKYLSLPISPRTISSMSYFFHTSVDMNYIYIYIYTSEMISIICMNKTMMRIGLYHRLVHAAAMFFQLFFSLRNDTNFSGRISDEMTVAK